jgi:two-component system, cell cycle sensor histidine kinase and response regulator CckA
MTSVAISGHLQSAHAGEACSDLNQVVARAESSISDAIGNDLSVQFALSPNVARVAVSASELQQIVVALCAEASGRLGSGGRVVIETRGLNDAPFASSTAPLPTAEAHARVIVRAEEPTPAAPRKSALRAEGRLGFPEVEALLRRLGGRLELVPIAERGLAYVLYLPYVSPGASSGRIPVAAARGTEVILLVEDEPQVQAVTARILRAYGYAVITAHNARTALAQAEQHGESISLVISDLVLPGVSGTDLVRRLRQPCEHARVLYMSGYSPEHAGALVDGASFLRKPFTADELLTMVRDQLASALH